MNIEGQWIFHWPFLFLILYITVENLYICKDIIMFTQKILKY